MRFPFLLTTVVTISTGLAAQAAPQNTFEQVASLSFSSRAFLGTNGGETLQGWPPASACRPVRARGRSPG